MADRTPYARASYDAVATTPRPPTPPTTTGLPRSEGLSRCSTAAKKASRSTWRIVGSERTHPSCLPAGTAVGQPPGATFCPQVRRRRGRAQAGERSGRVAPRLGERVTHEPTTLPPHQVPLRPLGARAERSRLPPRGLPGPRRDGRGGGEPPCAHRPASGRRRDLRGGGHDADRPDPLAGAAGRPHRLHRRRDADRRGGRPPPRAVLATRGRRALRGPRRRREVARPRLRPHLVAARGVPYDVASHPITAQ